MNISNGKGVSAVPETDLAESRRSQRNLVIRTLSACVFVPAILLSVRPGGLPLLALVLFIVCRGSWEFYHMVQRAGGRPCTYLGMALSAALSISLFLWGGRYLTPAVTLAALLSLTAALRRGTDGFSRNALSTLGGVIYLGLLGSAPLLIMQAAGTERQAEAGILLVLLFLCIWLTDATAYLAGRRFGRHKLAPSISPAKTVVGFAAGVLGGVLPTLLYPLLDSFSVPLLLGLLLLASLGGQLGDLVESAIKRDLGVKDAPALIPGHGGILDRFDSYLFAFPLAYLYVVFLGIF